MVNNLLPHKDQALMTIPLKTKDIKSSSKVITKAHKVSKQMNLTNRAAKNMMPMGTIREIDPKRDMVANTKVKLLLVMEFKNQLLIKLLMVLLVLVKGIVEVKVVSMTSINHSPDQVKLQQHNHNHHSKVSRDMVVNMAPSMVGLIRQIVVCQLHSLLKQ